MTSPGHAVLTVTTLASARDTLPWVPTLTNRHRRALAARLARSETGRILAAARA